MKNDEKTLNFQNFIRELKDYWGTQGCSIIEPYDSQMGAGTFHPATALRSLGDKPFKVAYIQPCRRPSDGRYGKNPNRLQHYYQFQVLIKPTVENIQDIYIKSLEKIGINTKKHDIRFVEDDWESPTLGAWGLGWEVWCDGMEITQFTYFQQIGGIECTTPSIEITYGLERLAMYIQGIENVYDLNWNDTTKYGEIFLQPEEEFSAYNFEHANIENLLKDFNNAELECKKLIEHNLVFPAYHQAILASNFFNLLDARGAISVLARAEYIERVRNMVTLCANAYVKKEVI